MKTLSLRDITYFKNKLTYLETYLHQSCSVKNYEQYALYLLLVARKINEFSITFDLQQMEQEIANMVVAQGRRKEKAVKIYKKLKKNVEFLEAFFEEEEEISEPEVITEPKIIPEPEVMSEPKINPETEVITEKEEISEPEVSTETEVMSEPKIIPETEVIIDKGLLDDLIERGRGFEKIEILKLQLDLAKQKGFYLMYQNKEKIAIQEDLLIVIAHIIQELSYENNLVSEVIRKLKGLKPFKELDYVTKTEELIIAECYSYLFEMLINLSHK